MSHCKFPGCHAAPHTDEVGHADDDYCLGHSGEVRRGVPVRDVEAGPYRAERISSEDYIVFGPHLRQYLMPRIEQAETLAQLLNLAYAAGRVAGKEEALGIIEREEVAREMGRIERRQSDASDDKCDRMRGN